MLFYRVLKVVVVSSKFYVSDIFEKRNLISTEKGEFNKVFFFQLMDLRTEESRVHVKPMRCGEASRKPRALSQVRTPAIDALALGITD